MVEEIVAKEETHDSSSIGNAGGGISETEEGEIVTGDLDDAEAAKVEAPLPLRHPLEHSWTFWFDNPSAKQKHEAWGTTIQRLYTFSTVEDFWSVYNNIHHPSKLGGGTDFHCFKHKIEPKWEDPVCVNGGKWTANFNRGRSDTSWLYTLLAMIGEQFDYGDEICGAVVSIRGKQEKVALWTKNAANEAAQMSIGRQLKEFLGYGDSLGYTFHEESRKSGRLAKIEYTT